MRPISAAAGVAEGGLAFVVFGHEVKVGETGEAEVFIGTQGFQDTADAGASAVA